jgi:hypothetical protein
MSKPKDFPMGTTILDDIKGNEIPRRWAEQITDSLDQTFTVIIKPKKEMDEDRSWRVFSLKMAMRGMEDEDSPEYSMSDLEENWQK